MDELLALLERYSLGYRENLRGVDEWCLEDLEELMGRPLPEFYKDFSRVMGQHGGPLFREVIQHELSHVMFLYSVTPTLPRRFLLLFGDPDPLAPHSYWLDLDAPSEMGDCQVVRMPFGETESSWRERLSRDYISLREMLSLWAMRFLHLPTFPHRTGYFLGAGRQTPKAEEVALLLEKMGFIRLSYPRYSMLFEREGAALQIYRPPGTPFFSIRVGMRDTEEFKHFQAVIEDNLDLEKSSDSEMDTGEAEETS